MKILCGSVNRKHNSGRHLPSSSTRAAEADREPASSRNAIFRSLRFGTQQWANIDSILFACTLFCISAGEVACSSSSSSSSTLPHISERKLFIDVINDSREMTFNIVLPLLLCTQVTYQIHPSQRKDD